MKIILKQMKIFKKDIVVTEAHLDNLNHVNNVRYIQWIEDVIKDHWLAHAPQALRDAYFWVVLNHNVSYKNPALLGDIVKFRTEVLDIGAATSNCLIEMYDGRTGRTFVVAKTRWCLLDSKTQKPRRITPEIEEVFTEAAFAY